MFFNQTRKGLDLFLHLITFFNKDDFIPFRVIEKSLQRLNGSLFRNIPCREKDGIFHHPLRKRTLSLCLESADGLQTISIKFQSKGLFVKLRIKVDDGPPDAKISSLLHNLGRDIPSFMKIINDSVTIHLFSHTERKNRFF